MIPALHGLRPSAAACAMCLMAATSAVAADGASPWDGDARSAVRLIAGSSPASAAHAVRAGLELRLKPGWHTYWRYPGDAGVPPHFDFAGSQNVRSVEVLWPAPARIREQGLTAIGYTRDVIWPLAIVAQDPAEPVLLRLKLDYAVCAALCVPAQGNVEFTLAPGVTSGNAALADAEARVPKKTPLGEGSTLVVKSVRRVDAPRPQVLVDVAAPPGSEVTLFAEGPTPDWALPVPTAIAGASAGLQRFSFDLDGAPPAATYRGARITVTAVAGDDAIEVTASLD